MKHETKNLQILCLDKVTLVLKRYNIKATNQQNIGAICILWFILIYALY